MPVVDLVLLVVVVTAVGAGVRRWDLPPPLVLVLVGVAGSFLPRYDNVVLPSEVVLTGILPPLLYAAALHTSLYDFRNQIRPILALSVGLVVLTTVGVGAVVWWVAPVSAAAALALGAVVAPPDAVAATAIARRVGLPRRMVTILEGESLVNDATALVCLHAAIAGITGSVTAGEVAVEFVVSAVGGVAVGLAVALVVGRARARLDDALSDTAIALITPFAAYIAAEEIHASGVLAVVVAGLVLGHTAYAMQPARSRLLERGTWTTIQFLLENSVFLLIGLQLRPVVEGVADGDISAPRIALIAAAAVAAIVLLRIVGVAVSSLLLFPGERTPWSYPAVLSWAGMRGVVTLAAASALPPETPHRSVLVLVAFVVTASTLLGQGFTLPALIRRTHLAAPDPGEDTLLRAEVVQRAGVAGLARLDALSEGLLPQVEQRLRQRSTERVDSAWERLGRTGETPSEQFDRVRLEMLVAERQEVLRIRDEGSVPHEVLAAVLGALDVEEGILDSVDRARADERRRTLVVPGPASCGHVEAASDLAPRSVDEGCDGCRDSGHGWEHLRMCLTCGYVGCCNSSPERHATRHFQETGHPVMRSIEPGEAWRWCYVDETLG